MVRIEALLICALGNVSHSFEFRHCVEYIIVEPIWAGSTCTLSSCLRLLLQKSKFDKSICIYKKEFMYLPVLANGNVLQLPAKLEKQCSME